MIVRTVNDLPELTSKIDVNSLFQLEQPVTDDGYTSMKVKYGDLSTQVTNESFNSKFAGEKGDSYTTITKPLNIKNGLLVSDIDNSFFDSSIDYTNSSITPYRRCATQGFVANYLVGKMDDLIIPTVMSSSVAISNSDFNEDNNQISVKYTDGSNSPALNMSNSSDGSLREIKLDVFTRHGYTEDFVCNKNGMLVVYGWCADYGSIEPQQCWIALGGYNEYTAKYAILKLEPWIQGQNHTVLQYFGFSIPVQKDLRVRIETGFEPNLYISGLQGSRSSLVGGLNGAGNGGSAIFYII